MKKFAFLFSFFVFPLCVFFAQESAGFGEGFSSSSETEFSESAESSVAEKSDSAEKSASKFSKSLFFTLGPKIMLNTDDSTKSAPSPVRYSFGIGGDFTFANGILLQVHGSFFTNYYLWDGQKAQPAEVENRTGTAFSLMFDLTGGYTFYLSKSKKHLLSPALGLGTLARFAILSNDVDADDLNRETGSKASDDVSDINSDFYSNLNFLYPEIVLSYSYILSENWKIGGEFRAYLPLGSLTNGVGMDGAIFSISAKLSYK